MNETGLVQIHCGDGRGKATAAIDVAVRAAGWGCQVLAARLLKTDNSRKITGLSHIPGITVLPCDRNFGSFWNTIQAQWKTVVLYCDHCLLNAWSMALGADGGEPYDTLVLDKVIGAYSLRSVGEAGLVKTPKEKPAALEIIPAGRCPPEALQGQTDYITKIVMRCHSYERGVGIRKGIEY